MSYILDALRRADAERTRGSVPGLHAQALPSVDGDEESRHGGAIGLWAAAGVSALLLAGLGWYFVRSDTAQEHTPTTVASAQGGPATTAAPAAAPAPAPAAVPVEHPPAAATPASGAALPASAIEPVRKETRAAAATHAAGRKTAAKTPPKASAPAHTVAAEGRIYTPAELPENVRRDLPALTVGGSVYSKTAADRVLIINGQVFHEGDKLAADLWLEQIRLKSAVLKFRGYRYAMGF